MVLVLVVSSLDLRKFLYVYCLWRVTRPFLGPAHQGLTRVVSWGCPSRFCPRPSGLNPSGGFFLVFSFFFTMPRRFPCTVSLDVKEFADLGTTRPEVVSKIINSFHPIKPIVAVQFVGYDAKVTFESEDHKREVMANEYVSIEGIECAVRGGGPRPQNVLVYNFPFEIPHAVVRKALSPFGEVESVNFRHWTYAREICDGVRTVRMVRSRAISRNLVIDGFPVKISYPGQTLECDICGESGHIAKNCSLRGKCLECRQSGHFQRNCPVRLRRIQRSVDSLDPVPPGDVSGPPPSASPPGAGPPSVVLSGVPPIAPLANQPDGVASEEFSSVDVRDNQLDEFASQSILADVSVVDPVSASEGPFGIKIGSSQPRAESQIPNLSTPVDTVASDVSSDNDSLVTVSEGEITSNSDDSNVSEHSTSNEDISESNVMDNTSTSKENISESNVMDNTNTTKENISESNVTDNTNTTKENISESNVMESTCTVNENFSNTKNSNVNDNVSNSLTNSGSNLVSPGSSLNSVLFSGGAEAPLSSVGVSDSAVRVSNVPSGLRLSKGSGSGVSKPAAARPSGLRPGLRKVISDWSLAARRMR